MDGQIEMKVTDAFRDFAKGPKKYTKCYPQSVFMDFTRFEEQAEIISPTM